MKVHHDCFVPRFEGLATLNEIGAKHLQGQWAFSQDEIYGLISQMRRAAVSIPSNIAEGKGRLTDRDRAHFYCQARGSLLELETQILIARELNYIAVTESEPLLESAAEIEKTLNGLVQAISDNATSGRNAASHP